MGVCAGPQPDVGRQDVRRRHAQSGAVGAKTELEATEDAAARGIVRGDAARRLGLPPVVAAAELPPAFESAAAVAAALPLALSGRGASPENLGFWDPKQQTMRCRCRDFPLSIRNMTAIAQHSSPVYRYSNLTSSTKAWHSVVACAALLVHSSLSFRPRDCFC